MSKLTLAVTSIKRTAFYKQSCFQQIAVRFFSKMTSKVRISVCQMTSSGDKSVNLLNASKLIEDAASQGSKMVFLPECADYIAEDKTESANLSETLNDSFIATILKEAKAFGIWVSLGSFHERQTSFRLDGCPWMSNTHVLIDDKGQIVSCYRKIHLFDVAGDVLGAGRGLRESEAILPGEHILKPVTTPIGNLGLGICYDLRFPEFSRVLRKLKADILTFPSAFTVPTGEAHWKPLLQARAIENQCYVIAAAQVGRHNAKRSSYGHAMVIDPWGKILCEAEDHETILHVDIDLDQVAEIRRRMPVFSHTKPLIYNADQNLRFFFPLSPESFEFSTHRVQRSCSFLETTHSVAFVNRKCVLPGHVLVISKRIVTRLPDLTLDETTDLFGLVKMVQRIMEKLHDARSTTISIQDGPDAGQTVQHVHVHVIPRKPMDFPENDTIYEKLGSHDHGEVKWRTPEEMNAEAETIRKYIMDNFSEITGDN